MKTEIEIKKRLMEELKKASFYKKNDAVGIYFQGFSEALDWVLESEEV